MAFDHRLDGYFFRSAKGGVQMIRIGFRELAGQNCYSKHYMVWKWELAWGEQNLANKAFMGWEEIWCIGGIQNRDTLGKGEKVADLGGKNKHLFPGVRMIGIEIGNL